MMISVPRPLPTNAEWFGVQCLGKVEFQADGMPLGVSSNSVINPVVIRGNSKIVIINTISPIFPILQIINSRGLRGRGSWFPIASRQIASLILVVFEAVVLTAYIYMRVIVAHLTSSNPDRCSPLALPPNPIYFPFHMTRGKLWERYLKTSGVSHPGH